MDPDDEVADVLDDREAVGMVVACVPGLKQLLCKQDKLHKYSTAGCVKYHLVAMYL